MKLKRSLAVAALMGAAAFSGSAFAGVTGNVGAVSTYMFRGLQQTSGAAIQGGVDYSHDSGLYAGFWASNIGWGYGLGDTAGGTETDFYAGFTKALGDFTFDIGGIGYIYPEQFEDHGPSNVNTFEGYFGVSYSVLSFKYYYSPKYFGNGKSTGYSDAVDESYYSLSAAIPLSDSLKLTASAGYTKTGEDVALCYSLSNCETKDSYVDYSVGLAKTIDESLSATFQVIDTTLKSDDPMVMIGIKKTFSL